MLGGWRTPVFSENAAIYMINATSIFSLIDGVPWPLAKLHIKRARHTQFYAPTKALKKEFWLYSVIILCLFI